MEKRMSDPVEPGQSGDAAQVIAVGAGLALFWAPLLSMLVRNTFPAASEDAFASFPESLLFRVAFCVGFALACAVAAHRPCGALGTQGTRIATALALLFCVDTLAVGLASLAGIERPAVVSVAAWALLGAGLASVLALWLPVLARLSGTALAAGLALSTAAGAVVHLSIDLLPAAASVLALAASPVASVAVCRYLERDAAPQAPIPLAESRKRAHLSWAFGIVNVIYGVVFGMAAATITQWGDAAWVPVGVAGAVAVGAACAYLLMSRSRGRVRQSAVMRFLFPVLVVALVPQALFSGGVVVACNVVLMGCYAFLILVSIGFEIRGARQRGAAALFFVGVSQTAFAAGLAGGFAVGMLPGVSGTFNHTVLAGVALGLVVAMAVIVATAQDPMANAQDAVDAALADERDAQEAAERGRWRCRCDAVARQAGLSARETEVFMLLAKGRGTEHIQNKLGISGHTVKTHTYNIYHKMGISSREELLDAVEAADPAASQQPQPPQRD